MKISRLQIKNFLSKSKKTTTSTSLQRLCPVK